MLSMSLLTQRQTRKRGGVGPDGFAFGVAMLANSDGTKRCSRCGVSFPISSFGRNRSMKDGLHHYCKICQRQSQESWRNRNPEQYRSSIARWQRHHREYLARLNRERIAQTPGLGAEYQKRYRLAHPESVRESNRREKAKSRASGKTSARKKLSYRTCAGLIARPENCERCGASGRVHGHHPNYTRPLDVVWLCPRCHGAEHRKYQ